jgi:YVTN family beta-propeller protein
VAFKSGVPDKSFTMNLSNPTGATLGTASALGVIHADPYLAVHSGSLQDAVIDPTSRVAFITNFASNEVEILNLATGAYLAPIPVGSQPQGIDVTPDGKTLYVCDSGGQTISVVDVASRKVIKTIITPAGFDSERAYSIAIGNNGHALFTTTFFGSGFGAHVYDLNLTTDAISIFTPGGINGQVTEITPVFRSADYSTIGGLLGDDSGGPFFVYHVSSSTTVSGGLSNFIQWGGLSGNGKTLLVDPGTYVVDTATGALLGTITGNGSGLVVSSTGTAAGRLEPGDVGALNVSRFMKTGTIPTPDATNPGNMTLSPNSAFIVAMTTSGATVIRL